MHPFTPLFVTFLNFIRTNYNAYESLITYFITLIFCFVQMLLTRENNLLFKQL